jgi:CubicO group peptidase (beta-lactamase class C family)
VTKPLVALGLMRLLERGALCLDDPVERFLPQFQGHVYGGVTMHEILTHTSALQGPADLYRTCLTKQALIDGIYYMPPRSVSPRTVEYSSLGFILLGEIIAGLVGEGLAEAMQALVFDPLGMADTGYNPPEALHARIASTEDCRWRGHMVIGEVHDENAVVLGGACGHAGLFSTAQDLAKICRMMLDGRDAQGGVFLTEATRALMRKNHTAGLNHARGLGWQGKDAQLSPAGDLFSERSFGHTGYTGTSLWIDPERGGYAVLLTNRVHPTRNSSEIVLVRHVFHNLAVLAMEG